MSKTEYSNNNNITNDNGTEANDDKRIVEQDWETKRQHKQAVEREQEWHYNNNKRLKSEANKRETEKKRRERERQYGVYVKQPNWT